MPIGAIKATDLNDPLTQFLLEMGKADLNSWGILVNTFVDLEMGQIPSLEAFYEKGSGALARACCVGPLFLYNINEPNYRQSNLMKWLNQQLAMAPSSVIYVLFGSQANLSDAQLDELSFGLEEFGKPFIRWSGQRRGPHRRVWKRE